MSTDTDVVDLAFAQANRQDAHWETRIVLKQGEDGLPHPAAVESKRK